MGVKHVLQGMQWDSDMISWIATRMCGPRLHLERTQGAADALRHGLERCLELVGRQGHLDVGLLHAGLRALGQRGVLEQPLVLCDEEAAFLAGVGFHRVLFGRRPPAELDDLLLGVLDPLLELAPPHQ
eukprot:8771375-Pyramimonas_sp.AAC.1